MNAVSEQNKIFKDYLDTLFLLELERLDVTLLNLNDFFIFMYDIDSRLDSAKTLDDIALIDKDIAQCNTLYEDTLRNHFKTTDKEIDERGDKAYTEALVKLEKVLLGSGAAKSISDKDMSLLKINYKLNMEKARTLKNRYKRIINDEVLTEIKRFNLKKVNIECDIHYLLDEEQSSPTKRKSKELLKIYSYKDMEDLAVANGFILDRISGDHKIYKNSNTYKIVVIPAHELGHGLMCKIQKQIKARR